MTSHIGRREFIAAFGLAVVCPLAAHAQQPSKVPRVGYCLRLPVRLQRRWLPSVKDSVISVISRERRSRSISVCQRGMDALPALAAELVRIPVNVIVADSTNGMLAAFDATRTIPIVIGAACGDPVALGLAKSLSRPGGNVTGTSFVSRLSEKRLQLLKLAFPAVQRVAVLGNPNAANTVSEMPNAEMAAAQLGVRLVPFMASTPAELHALAPSALSGSDGLLVISEAFFHYNRATIIDIVSKARVPAIYPEREYADDGGLIAYGPNVVEHFRQAAGYVDRILRGANPSDLPINVTSKFDFVVNLKTARALGLTPSPEFLSTADEVIE